MHVLLTGASGFVGRKIVVELRSRGHRVRAAGRNASARTNDDWIEWVEADFVQATNADAWDAHLEGVDAVINAVGIIRETRTLKFQQIHADAPRALFQSAVRAGVNRIAQISASGVSAHSEFEYYSSKSQADDFLLAEGAGAILRPSFIYGDDGEASMMFQRLSSLPLVPLVGDGSFRFRPILVTDVARAAVDALEFEKPLAGAWELGGEEVLTLREILLALRAWRKNASPESHAWQTGPTVGTPLFLMRFVAWLGGVTGFGPMDSDMLGMLVASEAPDISSLIETFGWTPVGLRDHLQQRVERALSDKKRA